MPYGAGTFVREIGPACETCIWVHQGKEFFRVTRSDLGPRMPKGP